MTTPQASSGKTLFLDFDGVLNNDKFIRTQQNHAGTEDQKLFDQHNVHALNKLCARGTISNIVITSTWRIDRNLDTLRHLLKECGFEFPHLVIDTTPVLGQAYEKRENEIREWLKQHPGTDYIILDDWDFTSSFGVKAFHVPSTTGLTPELVARILDSL